MNQHRKEPKLLQWSKDGYPPIDLNEGFRHVIELIKHCQHQSELLKAAEEVVNLVQAWHMVTPLTFDVRQSFSRDSKKALENYNKLKYQKEL